VRDGHQRGAQLDHPRDQSARESPKAGGASNPHLIADHCDGAVVKASGRAPGVFFSRGFPEDDTLADRVRAIFDRKATKLAKHHSSSTTTILLVENDDIALMNKGKLAQAIREAYPAGLPAGVDQVWYADTAIPRELEFCDLTHYVRSQP
jgi:hypothetical protein